jgi:competence protein ComEC
MRPIIYLWQKAPFTRLVVPFIAGILIQWYSQLTFTVLITATILSLSIVIGFFFFDFFRRYKLSFINGIACFVLLISTGGLLTYIKDIRHQPAWFGNSYRDGLPMLVTLNETPVEKQRSFKAEAMVSCLFADGRAIPTKGKVIIYFPKDSTARPLLYGSRLILKKPLQEIRNTGNPGAFDYRRYSLFHEITHQVYLKAGEYVLLNDKGGTAWKRFLCSLQERILSILRNNIKGEKETGLAEALLIGYKNDLDKSLVQSYSNTGVVHVIAISGLHLGIVYWILARLFMPLQKRKRWKYLRPVLIIAGLWIFSCLAGAQPSIVRSALMFSCIVAGETLTRRTNIFNTLALSVFLLLCYNPWWLWDPGFQLSYAAVSGLVLFMRPVYRIFYFKNRFLDMIWQMNAVTLAAQLLTLPISIYYFHQFPNYFLLTNLIAVPLSTIILICEIVLCAVAAIPFAASLAGQLTTWLIWLMNICIEKAEAIPYALSNGLQINVAQAILFTLFILSICYSLINKSVIYLKAGLLVLLGFAVLRTISFIQSGNQQKLIVYNMPQRQAIDIIQGHHYTFIGDSSVEKDQLLQQYHLWPSRVMHRVKPSPDKLNSTGNYFSCNGRRICLAGKVGLLPEPGSIVSKPFIDLMVLSKDSRIYIARFAGFFTIKQVVFDASVPSWKLHHWKRECDSLRIPWHDVNTKGAFAINLR